MAAQQELLELGNEENMGMNAKTFDMTLTVGGEVDD